MLTLLYLYLAISGAALVLGLINNKLIPGKYVLGSVSIQDAFIPVVNIVVCALVLFSSVAFLFGEFYELRLLSKLNRWYTNNKI